MSNGNVRVRLVRDRFNLCSPNEFQWCASITNLPDDAPRKGVSTTWPDDDEPNIHDNTSPSEAAEIISERIEEFWISTSREKDRETIAWILNNAQRVDADWAQGRLKVLQAKRERIDEEIRCMKYMATDHDPQMRLGE